MNGVTVKSCTILAVQADGAEMTTIEGLAQGEVRCIRCKGLLGRTWHLVRLLHAGDDHDQRAAVRAESNPTDAEIRHALEGNCAVAPAISTSSMPCNTRPEDAPGAGASAGLVLRTAIAAGWQ